MKCDLQQERASAQVELSSTATSDGGVQKLGNDIWHDSKSITTKVCSPINSKWNVMFENDVVTSLDRTSFNFQIEDFLSNLSLYIIIYCHCVSNQPSITWSRRSILNFKFWVLTFSRLMSCSMSNDQNCAMWKHFNSIALTRELFILLSSV